MSVDKTGGAPLLSLPTPSNPCQVFGHALAQHGDPFGHDGPSRVRSGVAVGGEHMLIDARVDLDQHVGVITWIKVTS